MNLKRTKLTNISTQADFVQAKRPSQTAIAMALAIAFSPSFVSEAVAQTAPAATTQGTLSNENGGELSTVTVLGTREAGAPLSNVPASISVVPSKEIAKQQTTAPRIEDILTRTVPGFNPTNNGVRQIRGRTAQVFINGAPVNEQMRASSGGDLNLLSPWQLGGIEVSRGANSAYGFGSPGGIIALTTPRAESDKLTLTTKVGASVNTNKVGGSQQLSLYQSMSQIRGAFDYHVGAMIGYDGLEYDRDGKMSLGFRGPSRLGNGKEDIRGLDWSLGYDMGSNGELRFAGTFQHVGLREAYDSNFAGAYRGAQSNYVRVPENDQGVRRSHTQNLTYENQKVGNSALKIELVNSHIYTEAYTTTSGRITRDEQTNQYYGVRSSVTTPLDFIHKQMTATYGFDFMRNRYFRPVYFTDTGAVRTYFSPDVTLDSYAPYLQTNLSVGNFKLTAGVRHEEYRGKVATAIGNGGITGGDIKPFDITLFNAGLVYKLNQAHDLFATYTQGAEISQLGRAARGAGNTGNLNPQPAKSNQYEIGLRRSGPLAYSIAAFYTESDLMSALQIDPANPTGPQIPLREPREIWGLEGTLNWKIDQQWATGGTFSWQKGTRVTPAGAKRDITARDVPPLLLSTFVDYSPSAAWSNTLQFDYWASANRFGNSTAFGEGRIDSVWLAHLSSATKLGQGELRFGIRNLFNKKYFGLTTQADNSGSFWIPEEGRRLTATYTIKW